MDPWFMCAQWVPKFNGGEGTVKFVEWKAQVQAVLRAQALTEDQQVDFVLGALEGTARREVLLLGEWQTIDAVWEELDGWWCEQEPGSDEENNILLRDQFLLGLEDGPVKRKLQWQVRRQDSLTYRQVTTEARALEKELRGEGSASQTPAASLAMREPAVPPEVDLKQWKEEVKNELQDLLAALGRTLVAELRQQCTPGPVAPSSGGTEARGADNNHPYAPFSDQHSFPYWWDEQGRPICHKGVWRCGTCAVEVPHSLPSWGSVKCQPPATVGHMGGGKDRPTGGRTAEGRSAG
ncbi:hypothetical protein SKAU_G00237440 [Synaphobranchus kaupii]|uniref:Uncharacterized protein n=1 Tax=Synaphobranchus kaupii TaxID=118154 RepID=A0A9Q1IRV2_SYNKA|nr:hypothetical protein SKAU_G00237440 [Synaphobranchus kaupii]